MQHTVYVDGNQGTTGLLIHQHLAKRNDIELLVLPEHQRKDPRARADALAGCDVAILCLPDAAAAELLALAKDSPARIIDTSSAHRTHAEWVYGFPELTPTQSASIASATRVSNPGCYPTGAIALLRPLLDAGLVSSGLRATIHAVSGYSGRGKAGIDAYEGAASADAPALWMYGLSLAHKHVPEIQQYAGLHARPIFVPAYGAFRQGIVMAIALHADDLIHGSTAEQLADCLRSRYLAYPNIQVMSDDEVARCEGLDPQELNGSNALRLGVFGNPRTGQMLLTAVFDNLGKGAAGAAVQNLDLMLYGS